MSRGIFFTDVKERDSTVNVTVDYNIDWYWSKKVYLYYAQSVPGE